MSDRDPLADAGPLIHRVYAYVAYRVGDGPDAEDVTSSVFERALRYRERFDGRKGDALAWLIGIARREISDHFAARRPTVAQVPDRPAPGVLEDDSITLLDLRSAVQRLSDRDRELIAFRYGADLTARQIGELLGLQTNAVEVAIHRALATLRELVDRETRDPAAERRERELTAE